MRRVVLLFTCAFIVLGLPAPAGAQSMSERPQVGTDFALSVPSEPLVGHPGDTIKTTLRLVNRSNISTRFDLHPTAIEPGDNGQVVETTALDRWLDQVTMQRSVEVAANSYLEIPVTMVVPQEAPVDIHLVGFEAEPLRETASDAITVRSAALNHVAVEVPGVARRAVSIRGHSVPRFVLGTRAKGHFDVYNTGDAGVRFRAQVFVNSAFGGRNLEVVRVGDSPTPELLPRGKTRAMNYEWTLEGAAGIVRPLVEVDYSDGEHGMVPAKNSGPMVIMIAPATAIAFGVFVLLIVVAVGIRRLRKRLSARGAGGAVG